jgi:NAD(P)-dependent dehydrogenase (short-subunit alcohol dehydrogenase family)
VPVETSKGEWGKGQHELNIRYAEVLDMADRHAVFKQALKEIAESMGMSVTFMAKFAADGAGSSCHIHFSLWRDKKNAFAGQSDTFKHFLGGWIAHVPDVMVFYAPTVNSYKRYVDWLVGADAHGVEHGQPHRRVPRGRQRPEPAHRVPHPRRRLQPLPRPRRLARLRPRRHQEQDQAAGSFRRRHLPGAQPAARAVHAQPGLETFEKSAFVKKAFGARSSSTTAISTAPEAALRQSSDRLGTSEILREDMRLKDKVALITGAGSGIGLQTVLLFAKEGASIVAVDVNEQAAQDAAKKVKNAIAVKGGRFQGGRLRAHGRGGREEVRQAERDVQQRRIMHSKDDDAMSTPEEIWDLTLDINAKGVFLGCKYGIPALKRAGGGSIINTASFVARLGAATPQVAYTASKGAVLAMTRELAVIHARQNIRVNALCPGPLKTELLMAFLNTEAKKQRRLVHVRWDASARPRRSPRRRCSWHRTTLPTSPAPTSWSMGASPPPT